MKSTIFYCVTAIASMLNAQTAFAQHGAKAAGQYIPPPQQTATTVQQQVTDPDPVQDRAATVVNPASLEEQVQQLQAEVSELQTFVQQLQQRLPPSDYLLSRSSPAPGLTCGSSSLTPANDILSRAYNLNDFSQRPYPDDTVVMMWSGCRR